MLKKFLSDTRGNVLSLVALTTPVMLLAAGAGLDMAELYRAKSSFQAAVDAAALASAKVLTTTGDPAAAKTFGKRVFQANIENLHRSTANIVIDTGDGDCSEQGVVATASLRHPMMFDKIHKAFAQGGDADHANLTASSTVKCGGDSVEIALVLDNSGSMSHNGKIGTLKTAAKQLVNTIHDSMGQGSKPKPVQFSVVPFTAMVNVGNQYKNTYWMDKDGRSPVHHEHFDWNTLQGATQSGGIWRDGSGDKLTRYRLYDELNISWKGCVEQRPYPHHTTDVAPSTGNPETLFVPSFAPDTPDDYTNERETTELANGGAQYWCVRWYGGRWRAYCRTWNDGYWGTRHPVAGYPNRYGGDYDYRGRYIGSSSSVTYGDTIYEERYDNNYLEDAHNMPGKNDPKYVGHKFDPSHVGSGEKQYSRQRWGWKYFNNATPKDVQNGGSGLPSVVGLEGGPNLFCTVVPMSPLTTSRNSVLNSLNQMQANGATNVQQGISWGWKTLSKGQPFTQGRENSVADNKKIMVVMTDGNNTYYPSDYFYNRSTRNPSYYSSHGFNGGRYATDPVEKRLFTGFDAIANPNDDFDTYRKAMDEHMVETCENAKNDGIQVFTIAFDVPNGSSVKQKLTSCASKDAAGEPMYYDANNNAKLLKAFESIADRISELSITK